MGNIGRQLAMVSRGPSTCEVHVTASQSSRPSGEAWAKTVVFELSLRLSLK